MAIRFCDLNDVELWGHVLAGDQSAWKEVVLRYKSLIYAVCTYMHLSQTDAADCFQQTWTLLYRHRNRLEDPTRLSSWLVTTARREAMRMLRQGKRFSEDEPDVSVGDTGPQPDQALEQLELQAHLEIALGRIDQPCQKLLTLFFFANTDMTYEQIAQEMNLAPNTLGAKRRRCLEKLRLILSDLGYEQERNLD